MAKQEPENPQTAQGAKQAAKARPATDRTPPGTRRGRARKQTAADPIRASLAHKPGALINLSQVKAFLKQRGLRISPKALTALDEEVQKICLRAGDKVLADRRKTVKKSHI